MLLKTNERNRTITANQEEWDSFRSTPQGTDEEDVPIENLGKFGQLNIDSKK
jgi:hypothetical protein